MSGGISDLYLVTLKGGAVRRLTNDRYAELHPAWSPDGKTLAFTTDRGPGTDFDALKYGPMNLALMDLSSGTVRQLDIFPGAKHINPQYAPDGRQLYFVSDREGFSDIYRLDLASNQVFQVTRTATGISGITSNSPTLSVARKTGRMVFSIFHDGGNLIHALSPEQAQGTPVPAAGQANPQGSPAPATPAPPATPPQANPSRASPLKGRHPSQVS